MLLVRMSCPVLLCLLTSKSFSQEYVALVRINGNPKWQYASLDGQIIFPGQFTTAGPFSSAGVAAVYEEGKFHVVNLKGQELKPLVDNFELAKNFYGPKAFSCGLIPVKINEKWGYLDSLGGIRIAAIFEQVNEFDGGFAAVRFKKKFLVLTTKGQQIPVDEGVRNVREFSEGLAPFEDADGKAGFIGTDGKIVIPGQFKNTGQFSGGLAWARIDSGLVGFIGRDGNWVIKPTFVKVDNFDPESGMTRVMPDKVWEYIDTKGNVVEVHDTSLFGKFENGLAMGRRKGKVGFFDKTGQWVIAPQFDGARHFKHGYAAARLNKKWGVIDKRGKWVIEPEFDDIEDMERVN
jgi:hypothetical protein